MKVTFELEDDEEGVFDTASFCIPIDSGKFFWVLVETANQFLYPFVNGRWSLRELVQELACGDGEGDIEKALELDAWKLEALKNLRESIDKAVESKST